MKTSLRLVAAAAILAAAPAFAEPAAVRADVAGAYYKFLLGRYHEGEGEIDQAIAAYREAARLDPSAAEIHAELAALFARQTRIGDATTEARAALALDPANREANRVLGSIAAASLEDRAGAGPSPAIEEAIGYLERGRAGSPEDDALDLTLARLYLRASRFDKAVTLLSSLVVREPSAEAYLLLAQAHTSAGHPELAAKVLDEGAAFNPRLLAALGELYERQQQYEKAADAFGRASAATPSLGELKLRWATALLAVPDDAGVTRARDVLASLVAAQPGNDRGYYLLAQAERRLKHFAAAETAARRVAAIDPKGFWGPFALAQIYEDQRQYRQVLDTLAPIVSGWVPSDTLPARQGLIILTHLGFAQMQLGENAGAVATFELARRHADGDPSYDMYLAQAYLGARRFDDALKVLGPLRVQRPQDARLAQLQARVLSAAGRRDQAVAVLQDTVKKNPAVPAVWLSLADTLSVSSRTDEAFKVLDDASARFPDNVAVPFQRGALYERAKDYVKAERSFRDVLAKDPHHAPALNYLGYMFAERGERLDEAVDLIQRALQVDPGNGSYLDSLGWALYKQRKLEQARVSLAQAAEQLPANSVVQDHFGDVLAALGRKGDAVTAWKRALDGDMESLDRAVIERKISQARESVQR